MTRITWFFAWTAIMAAVGACGDDGVPADAGPDGALFDGGDDAGSDGGADGGDDAGLVPRCGTEHPTESRPATAPTPLGIAGDWMRGWIPGGEEDPHFATFLAGALVTPAEGVDASGVEWFPATVEEGGVAPIASAGRTYFVRRFDLGAGERLLARAGRAVMIASEGAVQTGDVYDGASHRVALPSRGAAVEVAVRVSGGVVRGNLALFTTRDEIYFDTEEMTLPSLRDGEDRSHFLGVRVVNLRGDPLSDVEARVLPSDDFAATTVVHPAIGPGATTQLAFELSPTRPIDLARGDLTVRLEVSSPCLDSAYTTDIVLTPVAADDVYVRTHRSRVDGSVQYYAVRPPSDFDPARDYALVLSLHGAGVRAEGQASSYAAKDWAYVVAATNRHRFGFDWEGWGRIDAIETLDDAMAEHRIDPTRVYLTGHSMGGHGTWQVGSLFPGRFALVGPSAGWSSVYSYAGDPRPGEPFASSSRSSDTNRYAPNLGRRAVYILHGDADDNVPVTEARMMRDLLTPLVPDLHYFEQPGAGHWWDADAVRPGVDCVDWEPMFTIMSARTLDPFELDFTFRSPSPAVSPRHSFVHVLSEETPLEDVVVESASSGGDVTVTTTNVRSMILDGAALRAAGVTSLTVDGASVAFDEDRVVIGPEDGKRDDLHGPLAQAFERPFCFVYADGNAIARHYAAYWSGWWATIGNGYACMVPASWEASLDPGIGRIHVAPPPRADLPFTWTAREIQAMSVTREHAALAFVQPRGEALDAFLVVTSGDEPLLFGFPPFSHRPRLPDYFFWEAEGAVAAGFFDADWAASDELWFGP